jgi:hypothetical protein
MEMNEQERQIFLRLTGLWALSEAALGGILHGLRFPFTGLVLSLVAIIVLTLLAQLLERRDVLIKATLIVISIKLMLSPHTPVNAYFAVSLQGSVAFLLLYPGYLLASRLVIFAVTILCLGALQKLLVLTLIYGQTLWQSLDAFAALLLSELSGSEADASIALSRVLVSTYLFFHVVIGLGAGLVAAKLPIRLASYRQPFGNEGEINSSGLPGKKRRSRWRKPGFVAVIFIGIALFMLPYYDSQFESGLGYWPLLMIFRSVTVLLLWFYFLGPLLRRLINRYIRKRQQTILPDLQAVMDLLPWLKIQAQQSWQYTHGQRWQKRLWDFVHRLPARLLWYPG